MSNTGKEKLLSAINSPMLRAFKVQKISASYLARKLHEELEACETKCFLDKENGEIIYSKPLIAWDIRQEARKDTHKLLGHYPKDPNGNAHDVPPMIVINVGGKRLEIGEKSGSKKS
jgi:hypothetical protein